jgi:hypothetical protein
MGAVDTTYTFTATDTITSTKMNNIIDQTTITSDAIIGTTLEVASGKLKIRASGITSNELGANSVTSTAITSASITPAKLSTGAPVWDSTGLVTLGTTTETATIIRNTGANGILALSNSGTGGINFSTSGPVVFNSTPLGTQTGTAPIYGIRAWVVFDPNRNAAGTADTLLTARYLISSGNVTSVTKTATGKYTILITTALPDANYSYFTSAMADASNEPLVYRQHNGTKSTTQLQIETQTRSGSLRDFNEVCVSFMR